MSVALLADLNRTKVDFSLEKYILLQKKKKSNTDAFFCIHVYILTLNLCNCFCLKS
uniref:Uncharacterized protein n=1 Tax=Rhizophora mucronata TaxID=61149 RepID=A0A2P2PA61_RHIMU